MYILQQNKILFEELSLENNFYIKDLYYEPNNINYWVYNVDGLDYYIPNYGYLVLFDSKYSNVENTYKIKSSNIFENKNNIFDKKSSVDNTNYYLDIFNQLKNKIINPDIFNKILKDQGGLPPNNDILNFLNEIKNSLPSTPPTIPPLGTTTPSTPPLSSYTPSGPSYSFPVPPTPTASDLALKEAEKSAKEAIETADKANKIATELELKAAEESAKNANVAAIAAETLAQTEATTAATAAGRTPPLSTTIYNDAAINARNFAHKAQLEADKAKAKADDARLALLKLNNSGTPTTFSLNNDINIENLILKFFSKYLNKLIGVSLLRTEMEWISPYSRPKLNKKGEIVVYQIRHNEYKWVLFYEKNNNYSKILENTNTYNLKTVHNRTLFYVPLHEISNSHIINNNNIIQRFNEIYK
jgi:hypothetical protein